MRTPVQSGFCVTLRSGWVWFPVLFLSYIRSKQKVCDFCNCMRLFLLVEKPLRLWFFRIQSQTHTADLLGLEMWVLI